MPTGPCRRAAPHSPARLQQLFVIWAATAATRGSGCAGQVYRSDHLADLSAGDLAQLDALGVARAVDFRGAQERAQHGYDWPQLQQHSLVIEPTLVHEAMQLLKAGGRLSVADTVALMQATYRGLVVESAPVFARWFALLLEDERPLVFHCTAGKDRTGWAAALLLHALGVPQQVIAQDYLLTNQLYRRPAALAAQAAQHIPPKCCTCCGRCNRLF